MEMSASEIVGKSIHAASTTVIRTAIATPMIAVRIGKPIAISEPNMTNRMTMAAMVPMAPAVPISGISTTTSPPTSVCNPSPARKTCPASSR